MTLLSAFLHAQSSKDYVVLRNDNNSIQPDTIFGEIDLPKNGVFWNVKISTLSGERKFKTKQVTGLRAGDLYFASIPYGKSYAIVPRIIDGAIDLYFYYTGSDRLSFISQMQEEFNRDIAYDDHLLISEAIWNATSNFYISAPDSNIYYKIPQSNDKFKEQISEVFRSNEDIYNKIKTGVYKPGQIGKIVKIYNLSAEVQKTK